MTSVQDVAPKIKGKMAVVKINTEKYSNLAAKYSVQELPTVRCPGQLHNIPRSLCACFAYILSHQDFLQLGVFKDGELVQRISGLHSSEQLLYRLSPYLMDPAQA